MSYMEPLYIYIFSHVFDFYPIIKNKMAASSGILGYFLSADPMRSFLINHAGIIIYIKLTAF